MRFIGKSKYVTYSQTGRQFGVADLQNEIVVLA